MCVAFLARWEQNLSSAVPFLFRVTTLRKHVPYGLFFLLYHLLVV